jgi:hypothetical protein
MEEKLAKMRSSPEKPGRGEHAIERSPAESRQGFRDRHVLYVLVRVSLDHCGLHPYCEPLGAMTAQRNCLLVL